MSVTQCVCDWVCDPVCVTGCVYVHLTHHLHHHQQDCNEYTRVILDTIQTEVPKSVVHCMVRRAKEQMLAKLYSHITSLQPWEVSTIMEEDHSVVQRRAATTNAIKELENAMLGTEKLMVR